jgi:hypothetical protein
LAGSDRIDLGLKIVATAIACFEVWKFFADRNAQSYAEAKDRSLGYIARFADAEILDARETLMAYWRQHPEFVSHVMTGAISEPAYDRFVAGTFGAGPDRAETTEALFRTLVLYDEMAFCRAGGICDAPGWLFLQVRRPPRPGLRAVLRDHVGGNWHVGHRPAAPGVRRSLPEPSRGRLTPEARPSTEKVAQCRRLPR